MSREAVAACVVGLAVAAILAALVLAPGSTSTEVTSSVDLDDVASVGPGEAVVIRKYESGGSSIVGFTLSRPNYFLRISFLDEAGCQEAVSSGDGWPTTNEECRSTVPVTGTVSGLGITATGQAIIGVDVDVSKTCYDTVAPGDRWPTTTPSCAARD